jgi:hypothetical protein
LWSEAHTVGGGGWHVSEQEAGPQRVVEYVRKEVRHVNWLEQWLRLVKDLI